jgi:thermitase
MTSASQEPDDRLLRWQNARAAHLATLPWLQTDTSGPRAVRRLKDELLVAAEHEQAARQILTGLGTRASQITTQPTVLGFLRMTAPGADIAAATALLWSQAGEDAAGPHHVFASSPFEIGGPYGPPTRAGYYALPPGPAPDATVRVAVVDTGVWRDSPLPRDWYEATSADYDDTMDPETDTGHANFITGVIVSNTDNARVRIVKVLDANGICTEADLAAALTSLDDWDVANLSLGGFTLLDHPPVLLRAALASVLEKSDRAVVVAAGNEACDDRTGRPRSPGPPCHSPARWFRSPPMTVRDSAPGATGVRGSTWPPPGRTLSAPTSPTRDSLPGSRAGAGRPLPPLS